MVEPFRAVMDCSVNCIGWDSLGPLKNKLICDFGAAFTADPFGIECSLAYLKPSLLRPVVTTSQFIIVDMTFVQMLDTHLWITKVGISPGQFH